MLGTVGGILRSCLGGTSNAVSEFMPMTDTLAKPTGKAQWKQPQTAVGSALSDISLGRGAGAGSSLSKKCEHQRISKGPAEGRLGSTAGGRESV